MRSGVRAGTAMNGANVALCLREQGGRSLALVAPMRTFVRVFTGNPAAWGE